MNCASCSRPLALLALILQLISCSWLNPQESVESIAIIEPEPPPVEATVLFAASVSAIEEEHWAMAENQLLALQQRYPEYSEISFNLGIVYLKMHKPDAAEAAFRQTIASDPAKLAAYNHLGTMLRQQGRFIEAETFYMDALEVQPEHADTHLNLGILCDLYLSKLKQARNHYETYQALQQEPDRKVAAWIADIDNRIHQLNAQENHASKADAIGVDVQTPEHE
jgi:Tfp pilus assembly protein PilF